MAPQDTDLTEIGRISGVYGVKGWVKIYSHTDPIENILSYQPWIVTHHQKQISLKVLEGKKQGKGLVARLAGVEDRDQAALLQGATIAIHRSQLPELGVGEYYWGDLEGLSVFTLSDVCLGKVSHLIETGANDVLVVQGSETSIDQQERLIPYLPERVVKEIDLDAGTIRVDWDPEF